MWDLYLGIIYRTDLMVRQVWVLKNGSLHRSLCHPMHIPWTDTWGDRFGSKHAVVLLRMLYSIRREVSLSSLHHLLTFDVLPWSSDKVKLYTTAETLRTWTAAASGNSVSDERARRYRVVGQSMHMYMSAICMHCTRFLLHGISHDCVL